MLVRITQTIVTRTEFSLFFFKKKWPWGIPLTVQGLPGLHAFTAKEGKGSISGRGAKILRAAQHSAPPAKKFFLIKNKEGKKKREKLAFCILACRVTHLGSFSERGNGYVLSTSSGYPSKLYHYRAALGKS